MHKIHKPSSISLARIAVAPRLTVLLYSAFLFIGSFTLFTAPQPAYAASGPLSDNLNDTINVRRPSNPEMRVLLGDAIDNGEENQFTANGKFVVEDSEGNILSVFRKKKIARITYEDGLYTLIRPKRGNVTSELPLRVTPVKMKKKVTALTYENRPGWNEELNDNTFFGSVEVIWSDNSDQLLLVNQLGIEKYIRGIGEAGNENDEDYLQALLTAARTYAYWHILHPSKHADEPYILSATANDQVYIGASFTERAPNIKAAQIATKKKVITYDDDLIIAAYFSQSDGRTRSWDEVWYGEYPWAVSVEDPCCEGSTQLGHGVGLSAVGARYFADEEGWGWKKILKYYYTGVDIVDGY